MAVTNVRGRQLRDDDVYRQDLNTTVSGSAVIRKVIAGTGISLSSTGVDTGTGDVTISTTATTLNGTGYVKMSGTNVSYVPGATTNVASTVVERDASGNISGNIIYANQFEGVNTALNSLRNNLGDPTVDEKALFHGQFNNKFRFVSPTLQEESTDGTTWVASSRATAAQLGDMMRGEGEGTDFTAIPAATIGTYGAYRLTWNVVGTTGYVYLNQVYIYNTTQGNNVTVLFEAFHNTNGWTTIATNTGNNWPGHFSFRHTTIPYSNNATHYSQVRLTFSTTHSITANSFQLYAIEWFGGFPAGKRNVESYDRLRNVTFPANVTGSAFIKSGGTASQFLKADGSVDSNVYVTGGPYLPTAGGTLTGQLISTFNSGTGIGAGQIYLNASTNNRIDFNTVGIAAPALTTRSAGTKIVLYPAISATLVDYALGITNSTLWYSVPSSAEFFRWYGGTTNIATLTGAGALSLSSSITATNLSMSGAVDNYIAGNLGLGVVTPTTKFDVSGTGRFVNTTASNNGGALFTGTIPTAWPFPLETSAASRYTIIGQGTSGAISFPSINNYGTVGVIGTTIGSTGGRTNMGVFGYTYFSQNMSGNSGNRGYGGYFLAKGIGSVTDFIGTYAGIYAEASMGSDTGTAGDIVAADLVSVGKAQQIAYGARINVSGGGTNYGVYVTADRNYFSGNVGIKTTNPLTSLHAYTSTADNTAAGRTTPLNVLTLEVENISAAIEYAGFGGAIVFRGSTYNNTTQRTLGRIVHQINDSSVGTQGTSLAFELSPDATNTTLVTRMLLNFNGQLRLPSYTSSTSFTGTSAGLLGIDSSGNVITESITLSGAVTGTGTESITTTLSNGVVGIANLSATGTASAFTYLRGDNTWATIPSANSTTRYDQSFTATAGQTQITVNNALAEAAFDVYINGVKANVDSFTWSGSTITFVDALAAGDIVDVVNYVTVSQVGTAYGSAWSMTSGAGTGTAVFDTVERSGVALYDVVIIANSNSDGSASYRDYYYGKLAVTTGYNGAAVVHYIHFIQESPMPRTMHGSGGGNLSVDAVFFSGSSESTTFTVGSNYVVRFKISGYITTGTGSNTTVFLKQIG